MKKIHKNSKLFKTAMHTKIHATDSAGMSGMPMNHPLQLQNVKEKKCKKKPQKPNKTGNQGQEHQEYATQDGLEASEVIHLLCFAFRKGW
jgi:hypothetical protein